MLKKQDDNSGSANAKTKAGGIKNSLFFQVIILFICGALVMGIVAYFAQLIVTQAGVQEQTEKAASSLANEVDSAIREYPAYKWLVEYWYRNADKLDIEYDVDYGTGTETEKKVRLLQEHAPGLQLKYATEEEIRKLSKADRKLYAEITYSWLITRVDQIKRANSLAFLFCVLTDDSFKDQFFFLSGADKGATRGTNYSDVYTLGVTTKVAKTQEDGMRNAKKNSRTLVDAGDYVDYYAYVDTVNGKHIMIGLTYDLTELNNRVGRMTRGGTMLIIGLELLFALICLALIFRVVIRPIKMIQKSIHMYMRSKDSSEVSSTLSAIKSGDEIGQLSVDVTDMTKEIDAHVEHIEKITEERQRISTELTLAARIQEDMLPSIFPPFPERTEFDLYAKMDPAKEIGGDFYNFFLVDKEHLCLLIADVSGKGIPAAMFMMACQIIIENNVNNGKSPAEAIRATNETLCKNNIEDMFVTVWLGILEIKSGKLTAVNAGHEYPVIGRSGKDYELVKDKHCMIVGGMEGLNYKEYELTLDPGDVLFLYTDGVPEATASDNEMFGTDRMLEALNSAPADPKQILLGVRESVDGFIGDAEQFDDLTMLCLKYKG